MAQPLEYHPYIRTDVSAQEELEDLLETLHESGVLRFLNGLAGQSAAVTEVAVQQIDTPEGRNAMTNGLALLRLLTDLDGDSTKTFVAATKEGLEAAQYSLKGEPPSLVGLVGTFRDPDVRRGLNALLTFLAGLGRHLNRNLDVR